jgi:hypothetical protein
MQGGRAPRSQQSLQRLIQNKKAVVAAAHSAVDKCLNMVKSGKAAKDIMSNARWKEMLEKQFSTNFQDLQSFKHLKVLARFYEY